MWCCFVLSLSQFPQLHIHNKKLPIFYVDLLVALELIDQCSPCSSMVLKLLIAQVGYSLRALKKLL
jgi:hypothetical protein